MASRKQEHIEHTIERYLIAQKNFSFKERAERDWKYCCKRCRRVNRQFSAPSAWVFVLICVKKTISMKILVLRVINSSRHRNCFVRGYTHSLFVSKALARSGFHTNNSWIQPRTPHFLWRKLYLCSGLRNAIDWEISYISAKSEVLAPKNTVSTEAYSLCKQNDVMASARYEYRLAIFQNSLETMLFPILMSSTTIEKYKHKLRMYCWNLETTTKPRTWTKRKKNMV